MAIKFFKDVIKLKESLEEMTELCTQELAPVSRTQNTILNKLTQLEEALKYHTLEIEAFKEELAQLKKKPGRPAKSRDADL